MYHIWDTCGVIYDDHLADNLETIKIPWQPLTPINNLFIQLKHYQAFLVLGNNDIADASKIKMRLVLVERAPFFATVCREWRAKSDANTISDNFRSHSQLAEQECNTQAPTTTEGGYHYANAASNSYPPFPPLWKFHKNVEICR